MSSTNEDKDAHLDEHLMINGEEWQHLEEALQEVDQLMIDGAARKKPCLDVTGDLTDICLATHTRSATKRQRAGGLQPSGPAKKVRWAQVLEIRTIPTGTSTRDMNSNEVLHRW